MKQLANRVLDIKNNHEKMVNTNPEKMSMNDYNVPTEPPKKNIRKDFKNIIDNSSEEEKFTFMARPEAAKAFRKVYSKRANAGKVKKSDLLSDALIALYEKEFSL